MIARKLAPALVTGCTTVIKPAGLTPYSALALCEICKEAGVLDGVVNMITSSVKNAKDIGKAMCENKIVRKLSFTGSTNAGITLATQSAKTLKRVSLELGMYSLYTHTHYQ